MKITVLKELATGDTRVPIVPPGVQKLVELGAEVEVESTLGSTIGVSDEEYREVGAVVAPDRGTSIKSADLVLCLNQPPVDEVALCKSGAILIGLLDPFNQRPLLEKAAAASVSSLAMEMIPRTTLAQKMDALSSQANLAGYAAVIVAADMIAKIFPMMSTPSGTIAPARVFVIGAGVAGLQAIATAKRLGAIVEAFDTRPVVEEQVRSLGGRFVKVDLGETGETKDGYAKELTKEQLDKQREVMARHCAKSDVVVTTAQVFGRRAPRIVTGDMVAGMKPGSVIVDLAVDTGGNVEGSEVGKIVEKNGVKIIGFSPLPARVAADASLMYSNNLVNLIAHFWDEEVKAFSLNLEDEIIQGCLVTHGGEICHEMFK
jgi:NAD(P) transhydrogenase subunit alpha